MTAIKQDGAPTDDPAADPIGAVREIQNHIYVKLADPADEPWHIAWCHGEQFMSGWQSNECMVGSTKWDGYLPVRECGVEGKHFVSWERWLETKGELDRLRTEHAQAVKDWGRNDEQVLADSQRLAEKLAAATALADELLAMFATGEKGHPGRACVRTGWIDETAIARLRERRAELDTAGSETGEGQQWAVLRADDNALYADEAAARRHLSHRDQLDGEDGYRLYRVTQVSVPPAVPRG